MSSVEECSKDGMINGTEGMDDGTRDGTIDNTRDGMDNGTRDGTTDDIHNGPADDTLDAATGKACDEDMDVESNRDGQGEVTTN